ncbi:hypothetical protein HELRODRAFT_93683 [Helobdella robusta]|uniref:Succinate dehydrogenase assembly factor 4, mitochondrial n=1 Tax=Helobdella robusta TaxID=6412 RepID=T1G8X4_HELRO|nr:hypothetical protein HELRODRAFT_93683 [Helobdella robusta]ESO13132.1 hypothetical protein HELRODRAFT_93683 [Helobdella robusta]
MLNKLLKMSFLFRRVTTVSTYQNAAKAITPVANETSRRFKSSTTNSGSGSDDADVHGKTQKLRKAKTPVGCLDDKWESKNEEMEPKIVNDPYSPFPDAKNPLTGEIGGPRGPEPTRYGDWERKGRVIDF